MEEPSREWSQALTGIEPVRFEFSYNGPHLLRDTVIVALVLPTTFALSTVISGFGDSTMWESARVMVAIAGICDLGIALWYFYRLGRAPQVVEFRGGRLLVGRRSPFKSVDQEFALLEIHDLHKTSGMRFGWLGGVSRGSGHGAPAHYLSPEPFGFTYHGRACSFGAAPMSPEAAERVMSAVAAYDAEVRARLGMPPEPNITTLDSARLNAASSDGWDVDMPDRALW